MPRVYVQVDPLSRRYAHMPLGLEPGPVGAPAVTGPAADIGFTQKGGLDYVPTDYVTTLESSMQLFASSRTSVAPQTFRLDLTPAPLGGNAMAEIVKAHADGYAVLWQKPAVTGAWGILLTKDPYVVASNAAVGGKYAVFDIPADVEKKAWAAVQGNLVPPPGHGSQIAPADVPSSGGGVRWLGYALGIGVPVVLMVGVLTMKPGQGHGAPLKANKGKRRCKNGCGKLHRNVHVAGHIRPGDRVTILDRFGKRRTGRAVMRGPHGWVLNMGGRHGTPAVADDSNIVAVRPKKGAKGLIGNSSLHERIAKALGWTVKDVQSFSLPALRELVRDKHPKLAHEITLAMHHIATPMKRNGKDPKVTLAQLKKDPGIRMVVGNMHVGTPNSEVEANFRARCAKAGYSEAFTKKVVAAALYVHHQNIKMYNDVMGGRFR